METPVRENKRAACLRICCVLLIVLYLLSLVPILYEGRYNLPISDDLTVTYDVEQVWKETGSLPVFLSVCLDSTVDLYNTWQGTYAANYLIEVLGVLLFNPHPGLTPLAGLGLLTGATLFLGWVLLKKILKTGTAEYLSITFLALIAMVQFCPSIYEYCFWFFSMMLYGGSWCVLLTLLGTMLLLRMEKRPGRRGGLCALAVALAVLLGGGTQPTLLPAFLLLCLFVLDGFLRKDTAGALCGLLVLAVHTAGLILNVAAPGNYARLDYETGVAAAAMSPVKAVLLSCVHALGALLNRIDGSMLLFALFTAVLAAPYAQQGPWKFRRPFVALLLSFGVYASLFVPLVYTKNNVGPYRVQNLYYLGMFLFTGFNAVYLTGFAIRAWQRREGTEGMPAQVDNAIGIPFLRPVVTLLVCALLLFASVIRQGLQRSWSYAAYQDLSSGWARDYHAARLLELSGEDPLATQGVILPNIINEK